MKDDPPFSDATSARGPAPAPAAAPQIDLYLDDPAFVQVTSAPGPIPVSTGPEPDDPAEPELDAPPPARSEPLPTRAQPPAPYPYRDRTQRAPPRPAVTAPAPQASVDTSAPPARPTPPARVRRPVPPGWWALGGVLLLALLALSWTQWPVRTVNVSGNTRVSPAELRRLAGLEGHFGWLYYGAWKAQGLTSLPWVKTATVTRQFPDTVNIAVTERQPFVRWQRGERPETVLLAEDGVTLPAAPGVNLSGTAELPLISGWGPPRVADALRLTRALSRYTVQSVTYTPSGFTAQTASGTVWGGDLNTLVKYAGSIGMYPNRQIYIYPWGVSVQE